MRQQVLLLWSREEKVGALVDMVVYDGYGSHFIPVVLLGILSYLFAYGWQVHR